MEIRLSKSRPFLRILHASENIDNGNSFVKEIAKYSVFDKHAEYEKKWSAMKQTYKGVSVFATRGDAYGEIIVSLIRGLFIEKKEGFLNVFIPILGDGLDKSKVNNKTIYSLFSQELYIVNDDEREFWEYLFIYHLDELDVSRWYQVFRRAKDILNIENCYNSPSFNAQDEAFGTQELTRYGLEKNKYICYGARSRKYYDTNALPSFVHNDWRNVDFSVLYKSIHSMYSEHGLMGVRIGRNEKPCGELLNELVDYAGNEPSDFMDLFLVKSSLFVVTSSCGVGYSAYIFKKPYLIIDFVPMTIWSEGEMKYDMQYYIPRKYYSVNEDRMLSLLEIERAERDICKMLQEGKILLLHDTEEEIDMAIRELYARIKGEWTETQEDQENRNRYEKIMEKICHMHSREDVCHGNICTSYLRNNMYLLDEARFC